MGLWDVDKIEYVGKEGLGFRYYDKNKVVAGKPMGCLPLSRWLVSRIFRAPPSSTGSRRLMTTAAM